MATRIPTPAITGPNINDWQTLLTMNEKISGSFMVLNIVASDGNNQPTVMRGSRFEINGSFFEVTAVNGNVVGSAGGGIAWGSLTINQVFFIYAQPQGDTARFIYASQAPVFDPMRGGLFGPAGNADLGPSRCIGQVRRTGNGSTYDLAIAAPQWMVPLRQVPGPLQYDNVTGQFSFRLPVLSPAQAALTENGDMWIEA